MRVPNWICDSASAASKAAGFAKGKMVPKARSITSRRADANGSISFMQVYDFNDEVKDYHFECVPKYRVLTADDIALQVVDDRGNHIRCNPLPITPTDINGCSMGVAVVSVKLPISLKSFYVGSPSLGMLHLGHLEIRAREVKRNCLMVNPGIDSLYPKWIKENEVVDLHENLAGTDLPLNPKMSIVTPLYNTPVRYFHDLVNSVIGQTYQNWELVLVNASPENAELAKAIGEIRDDRVKVVALEENLGISENTVFGIRTSSGDYVSFVDHDDLIEPIALFEYVKAINEHPDADLLYCSEDSITEDGSKRFEPKFKAGFNVDMLNSYNFVCHMLTVSREALSKIELYDRSYDGAQDYDMTLKVEGVMRDAVRIPKVLYHWRQHGNSTNGGSVEAKPYIVEASFNAIGDSFARRGIDVDVRTTGIPCVFETVYPFSKAKDVSLIVPFADAYQLAALLASLDSQRTEIIDEIVVVGAELESKACRKALGIGDEDGSHPTVRKVLEEVAGVPVSAVVVDADASEPAKMNAGAKAAKGKYLLFAQQSVRFADDSDCIGLLRDAFVREDIGIASAKAMTVDGLNLHAGLCVKEDGSIGYLNQGFVHGMGGGYYGTAECTCDFSAVDALCMMVRASDFNGCGGFCDEYASLLASAVDYSFKVRTAGKLVMVTPFARICAYIGFKQMDLGRDWIENGSFDHELLWSKWGSDYRVDVLNNPYVDLSSSYFRLKV